jgi:DNA polymerase-3 subunit beta
MMLEIAREDLLKPLQSIMGIVERRQTMPILANVLLSVDDGYLAITATDLEMEMIIRIAAPTTTAGKTTVAGRKLMDICRSLPDNSMITLQAEGDRLLLRSGRSRFTLTTLPAADFPSLNSFNGQIETRIPQTALKMLFEQTCFAMANQDVRYYLNGLLLEFNNNLLRAVGTDGHRLALCHIDTDMGLDQNLQIIVPRKAVMELQKLLSHEGDVGILVSSNHIRMELPNTSFTSKLIDGRFPEYDRVLPKHATNTLLVDRLLLRQSLSRIAILSNEKYRGVRLNLASDKVSLSAQNADLESAEEEIEAIYHGEDMEIGFNVAYLVDPLNVLETDQIQVKFTNPNGSCIISQNDGQGSQHVIMPMRL